MTPEETQKLIKRLENDHTDYEAIREVLAELLRRTEPKPLSQAGLMKLWDIISRVPISVPPPSSIIKVPQQHFTITEKDR